MDLSTMNNKLENALDIIMEHFSESEDRMTELEEQIAVLKAALEKIS